MKQFFLTFTLLAFVINSSLAQPLERDQVSENLKWNLYEIYPSVDAWQTEVNNISAQINKLPDYKGKLGDNAETLYRALRNYFDILKSFYAAATFAGNLSNENLNISANQALDQQITSVGTNFGENTAFMEPELLAIPKEKMQKFFKDKPELDEFSMYIDNIQRLQAHTLSEPEEKILASFGLIAGNSSDVYGIFNNAEMPFVKVTLSTGEEVELTPASYTRYRTVSNREDRSNIFSAFFKNYGSFKNTLGANLGGKVKKDWVYAIFSVVMSAVGGEAAVSRTAAERGVLTRTGPHALSRGSL